MHCFLFPHTSYTHMVAMLSCVIDMYTAPAINTSTSSDTLQAVEGVDNYEDVEKHAGYTVDRQDN